MIINAIKSFECHYDHQLFRKDDNDNANDDSNNNNNNKAKVTFKNND